MFADAGQWRERPGNSFIPRKICALSASQAIHG
jgi:hypothetical protein